jgi:3-oxoacyl-[acyl-carrier-protein] synthase-3
MIDFELAFPERTERLPEITEVSKLSRNQMRMFERFFGFNQFHCDDALPLQQLIGRASTNLLMRNDGEDTRLRYVVHCHTLPSTSVFAAGTSPVLAPFAERGIEVFSATMNHCATSLSMLGTMDRLLGKHDTGLILIGEKAFHPDIRIIENTTIMGEAAAAILVAHRPGRFSVIDTSIHHAPQFWQNSGHRDELFLEGFQEAYLPFASASICEALTAFGRSFSDIRYILPHNVNLASWYQIAQHVGFAPDKLCLSTIDRVGHCFGADPFINLKHAMEQGLLAPSDQVLLFSIGLGATASCALLQVN